MAGLTEIYTSMQNGVTAINNLITQLSRTFPQATTVSTSAAVSGTVTFTSSQAVGFLTVQTSSGASYKVALYT